MIAPPTFPDSCTLFNCAGAVESTISAADARRLCKRGIAEIVLDAGEIIGVMRHGSPSNLELPGQANKPGINITTVHTMAGGSSQHFLQPLLSGKVFALKGVLGSK